MDLRELKRFKGIKMDWAGKDKVQGFRDLGIRGFWDSGIQGLRGLGI